MYYNKYYDIKETDIAKFKNIPHGCGINYDWIITDKGKYFRCENSFHAMDKNGMYDGIADFSVIIDKNNPEEFRLHFHGDHSQYLNRKYMLREYLEDTFAWWISKAFKKEE